MPTSVARTAIGNEATVSSIPPWNVSTPSRNEMAPT
jgi:hypothetical protein